MQTIKYKATPNQFPASFVCFSFADHILRHLFYCNNSKRNKTVTTLQRIAAFDSCCCCCCCYYYIYATCNTADSADNATELRAVTGYAILSTLYDLKNRNNRRKITKPNDATNYGTRSKPTVIACIPKLILPLPQQGQSANGVDYIN